MINIHDFNDNELSIKNGSYGGMAGDKDGILLNGEEWMLKYPKNLSQMVGENASYSTAPLSEYLGSHIYEILGYDVHSTLLGEKNGKLVVACKDFATDKMLLEIRTLKNHTGKELAELLEGSPAHSTDTHVVDLEELLLHLDKNPLLSQIDGIKNRFFEQAIIDALINNNDRNNGNWGILREKGKSDRLAPVFDNGGSFSTKTNEEKIIRLLNSNELFNNSTNILTAYGKDGHLYSAKKFFDTVINISEFQEAVKKTIPLIKSKMPEIKNLIDSIPSSFTSSDGKVIPVISDARREFYKKQIDIRLEKLLQPLLEKVVMLQVNKLKAEMPENLSLKEQIVYNGKICNLTKLIHCNENRNMELIK